ncbi:hypothetical protein C0995_006814, partial [Termitomyces sp. Mi166
DFEDVVVVHVFQYVTDNLEIELSQQLELVNDDQETQEEMAEVKVQEMMVAVVSEMVVVV